MVAVKVSVVKDGVPRAELPVLFSVKGIQDETTLAYS